MKNTKYPFMVEFTGSPEAGKTTCIQNLINRFNETNLKVHVIRESAEVVDKNIPKGSFESHLSMRLLTLNKIIEAKYNSSYDIVLIDRGLIDGVIFTLMFLIRNMDCFDECSNLIDLLLSLKKSLLPDFLVILESSPDVSIKRKGHEGRLVNNDFIKNYNALLNAFEKNAQIPHCLIDTSFSTKIEITNVVFNYITEEMAKKRMSC